MPSIVRPKMVRVYISTKQTCKFAFFPLSYPCLPFSCFPYMIHPPAGILRTREVASPVFPAQWLFIPGGQVAAYGHTGTRRYLYVVCVCVVVRLTMLRVY